MHYHEDQKDKPDCCSNKNVLLYRNVLNTGSTCDKRILITPECADGTSAEESIDIRELDPEDIEIIRAQDSFMYHSIVQRFRKMRSNGYVPHLDGVDCAHGVTGPSPADVAAGTANPNPGTIFCDTAFFNSNRGPPSSATNAQSSKGSAKNISLFHLQRHHLSSSFEEVTSSSQDAFCRRFLNSSKGIVIRKSRISVETDATKEIADLMASLSYHLRSESASIFE